MEDAPATAPPLDHGLEQKLLRLALEVRVRAYAPYSCFHVGAAVLAESGEIYIGCNVENASYGLSLCAERNALAAAIAAGERKFVAMAVVGGTEQPATPCGACRQVMVEFAPNMTVLLATPTNLEQPERTTAQELLPRYFTFGGDEE
ncbi:MAG: cytidine deaminase [Candidatus Sumerlaeaceae bacterium]|jgi:cytidine deaminase